MFALRSAQYFYLKFVPPKNSNLLSHPAINLSHQYFRPIGQIFTVLKSIDSTNNYAMAQVHAGLASHGMAYFAREQFAGKGQRGKAWSTLPGENIILSIVLEPAFLRPTEQFILSAALAVSCHDFLKKYNQDEWSIKWPNDIYWRDRKAAGILIESICKGNSWLIAVAGIGININQVRFPASVTNATSLKQITGKTFDAEILAKELCECIEKRFEGLKDNGAGQIMSIYNSHLFKRNQIVKLKKGGIVFETTIKEVTLQGQLITFDDMERRFDLGDVSWEI